MGVAFALAGLVLTYNLSVPLHGRVGPFSMRTDLWALAGPFLLTSGMLTALVTRVSRRRAPASAGEGADAHLVEARHWHLKRVV